MIIVGAIVFGLLVLFCMAWHPATEWESPRYEDRHPDGDEYGSNLFT